MAARLPHAPSPPAWQVGLALGLVYVCWSTTYLAIQEGVRTLPPLLFGGTRVMLAGLVLLAWLALRGQLVGMAGRAVVGMWLAGSLMFLGGNGLITIGQQTVPSGLASVLVATTPLWLALLEWLLPGGERLPAVAWIGLLAGLVGVGFLAMARGLDSVGSAVGMLLCLGSAFAWSVGSIVTRYWPSRCSLVQTAAMHLTLGGMTMVGLGLAVGEGGVMTAERLTPSAVFAFVWLLVVGSLMGFVAYVWLLGHVSSTLAGSYAYVNPALAILIGWALGGEAITAGVVAGLAVILCGVGLVRSAQPATPPVETAQAEPEPVAAEA